jgi:hypothetical protein
LRVRDDRLRLRLQLVGKVGGQLGLGHDQGHLAGIRSSSDRCFEGCLQLAYGLRGDWYGGCRVGRPAYIYYAGDTRQNEGACA